MDERERYERGLAVRREVLGEEHVARALGRAGPLDAEFQDLITRYAWGEIWTRPGLGRRERSLVTISMLMALRHWNEFVLHLKAARRNGVTLEEIREVLMQGAIYCGVPTANHAFALARETFGEELSGGA
ncbi:hypothetical protein HRbin39_00191 [bacterium HR39]|nr:hypothetical protein HRbin39_00191 [bacterium HR39]